MAGDPFKFKLGLFVVVGTTLGVVGLLAVGAGQFFEENYPLYCYFEESVQGLEEGAEITYRGVQVGRVSSIGMRARPNAHTMGGRDASALIEVQAELFPAQLGLETGFMGKTQDEVENFIRAQVARGLRVTMELAGISGQKYLEMDFLDALEHPPPELGFLPLSPYIPTAKAATVTSIKRDLASTLSALSRLDYEGIADRVIQNLDSLKAQVDALDVKGLSAHAEATLIAVKELADSPRLKRAIERMDDVTAKLDSAAGRFDELLAKGELDQIVSDVAAATSAVKRMTEDLERRLPATLDGVDAVTADARKVINASDVPGTTAAVRDAVGEVGAAARSIVSMKEELRRAMRDMSQASRSVARLARSLEEHPTSVLTGKPRPGKE